MVFSLLEAAAIKGDVAIPLSGTNPNDEHGNYTLFAPTNQAFDRLGLIQNRDLIGIRKGFLNLTLNFHVANGILEGWRIPETASLASLVGPEKKIITRNQQHYINGSRILFTDVTTKNGVFHGIDIQQWSGKYGDTRYSNQQCCGPYNRSGVNSLSLVWPG